MSSEVIDISHETTHLSLVDTQSAAPPDSTPPNEIPEAPRISSQGIRARDITAEFTTAASTLQTGQLIKDEHFTLFESVGALEIMDAKMDSGYLEPGETLEDDYDVMRELLPEEVIGIMDQLLCHEMAWHMGHPLSQTLFTSIYIDRLLWPEPKELVQASFSRDEDDSRGGPWVHNVLRAYCVGLVKCCDFVHVRVSSEQFYEEEDFVTHLYNRNLFSSFATTEILALLSSALQYLAETTGLSDKVKEAVTSRLRFRASFLQALARGMDVVENPTNEYWFECIGGLGTVIQTHPLGKLVDSSFSLKIQRRLASSVPPRPMVKISFEDATTPLIRLCKDALDVLQVLDYHGSSNLLTSVWTLQSRRPQSSVYIRSLLQSLVFFEMKALGTMSLKQLTYDDLAEVVLPESPLLDPSYEEVELPSDPRYEIAKLMDQFVHKMGAAYLDLFRTACLNRSRIRRTICHTIVDWDSLQIDAEDLDSTLRTYTLEKPVALPNLPQPSFSLPLSSWTYHHKLHLLRLVLHLGFELSIYAPDELPGMYWYLTHICQTHIHHLDRIRSFTSRHLPAKSSKSTPSAALTRSLAFLQNHRLQLTATSALAASLHALYTIFARHSLLPSPSENHRPYSSDPLRYELRMKPFIPITLPELVPFADFQREVSCPGTSDARILDYATRNVAEARKTWEEVLKTCRPVPAAAGAEDVVGKEWEKNVKDTVRACIGASIAVAAVKKALDKKEGMKKLKVEVPEVGGWHVWWLVPKIVG